MEMLSFLSNLWRVKYSKGLWKTKSGECIYIEQLKDEHLMRIPPFLYKKGKSIPVSIRKEIKYRNMIILYNKQCKVIYDKKEQVFLSKKNQCSKINYDIIGKRNKHKKQKFNSIFFTRRKNDKR